MKISARHVPLAQPFIHRRLLKEKVFLLKIWHFVDIQVMTVFFASVNLVYWRDVEAHQKQGVLVL